MTYKLRDIDNLIKHVLSLLKFDNISKHKKDFFLSRILNIRNLSLKKNYIKGIAYSYLLEGIYLNYNSDFKNAINILYNALYYFEDLNDYIGITRTLHQIGYNFTERGLYLKGLYSYNKIIKLSKKYKIIKKLNIYSKILNNIGAIYYRNKLYNLSRLYFKKALKTIKNDKNNSASIFLLNIGLTYIKENKIKNGFKCFNKSIIISQKYKEIRSISFIYYWMGRTFFSFSNFNYSLIYLYKSLILSLKINNKILIINNLLFLIKIYLKLNMPKKINQLIKTTFNFIKITNPLLEEKKDFFKLLTFLYLSKSNYEKALKSIKYYYKNIILLDKNKLKINILQNSILLFEKNKEKFLELYEIKNKKLKSKIYQIKSLLKDISLNIIFTKNTLINLLKTQNILINNYNFYSKSSINKNSIYLCNIYNNNSIHFLLLLIKGNLLEISFISLLIYNIFINLCNKNYNSEKIFRELINYIKINYKNNFYKIKLITGNLYKNFLFVYSHNKYKIFISNKNKSIKDKILIKRSFYSINIKNVASIFLSLNTNLNEKISIKNDINELNISSGFFLIIN